MGFALVELLGLGLRMGLGIAWGKKKVGPSVELGFREGMSKMFLEGLEKSTLGGRLGLSGLDSTRL